MAELIAGAAIGTAHSELWLEVRKVLTDIRQFGPHLREIESSLRRIEPIIQEWDEYNKRLDRGWEETPLMDLFAEGRRLVERCSRIHKLNLFKKYRHSKQLKNFDAKLVREFQIFLPLLNVRTNGEILWEMKELRGEMNMLIQSGRANGITLRGDFSRSNT